MNRFCVNHGSFPTFDPVLTARFFVEELGYTHLSHRRVLSADGEVTAEFVMDSNGFELEFCRVSPSNFPDGIPIPSHVAINASVSGFDQQVEQLERSGAKQISGNAADDETKRFQMFIVPGGLPAQLIVRKLEKPEEPGRFIDPPKPASML